VLEPGHLLPFAAWNPRLPAKPVFHCPFVQVILECLAPVHEHHRNVVLVPLVKGGVAGDVHLPEFEGDAAANACEDFLRFSAKVAFRFRIDLDDREGQEEYPA